MRMRTTGPLLLGWALLIGISTMANAASPTPAQTQDTTARETQAREVTEQPAQRWHLSAVEWQRYQNLLKGLAGYRSDKLDPLTVLGIHARSRQERIRYARMLARMEHERIENVLAFQQAYDRAFGTLYPDENPVQTRALLRNAQAGRRAAQQLGLAQAKRLTVVVRTDGCSACRNRVEQLAAADRLMDIYVIGADTNDAIRQWATQVGLDPDRVYAGEVTLNHASADVAQQLAGQQLPIIY